MSHQGPSGEKNDKRWRIFLTGAGGRLGTVARPVLLAAGHTVMGVDVRGTSDEVHELNLLDGAAVRQAMQGCDAIVHLGNHAAQTVRPPAQLFNENVAMTMNVFDAARAQGVRRIINASTIQVIASEWLAGYSLRRPRIAYLPLDSHSPADPTNTYALSKWVGESVLAQWASEMELEAASLRFPMLADPSRRPARPLRIAAEKASPTTVAQGFAWLTYRDASELIVALLKAQWKGARLHMPAAPMPRTIESIAELLPRYYPDVPRKNGQQGNLDSLVDISDITRDTGWQPRDQSIHPPGP